MHRVRGLERIKLVGKVTTKPTVAIVPNGIGCKVSVEVRSDAKTGYDSYDIIVTKSRKPWKLKVGTRVMGIGILQGNTLWADYFREYPRVTEGE